MENSFILLCIWCWLDVSFVSQINHFESWILNVVLYLLHTFFIYFFSLRSSMAGLSFYHYLTGLGIIDLLLNYPIFFFFYIHKYCFNCFLFYIWPPLYAEKKIDLSLYHLVPEILGPNVGLIFHQNILITVFKHFV